MSIISPSISDMFGIALHINLIELREAIGEESVKLLLDYIQETIKKGIDEGINCSQSYIDKLNNISGKYR